MTRYYLGLNARRKGALRGLLTIGSRRDYTALEGALAAKYGGKAVLTKNGRTALMLALQGHCKRGDRVIVNGFTCYAVVEAIRAAGCTPVYADIDRETLNFNVATLDRSTSVASASGLDSSERHTLDSRQNRPAGEPVGVVRNIRSSSSNLEKRAEATEVLPNNISAVIVQNTLGIPVDMVAVEKFAKKHGLVVIEDLAHSVGVKYPDGREAGTVGVATILSFGKDKAIDTVSGGAVIYRGRVSISNTPSRHPRMADYLRERLYPLLAASVRALNLIHLGGALMRVLLALHLVEKSADNRLDATRRMPKFEAKLALGQLKQAEGVEREFYLVRDRGRCLAELRQAGYYFDGFWYERPVSPERYYRKAHFPEAACPVATEVAAQIINLPTYYEKRDLAEARRIIQKYEIKEGKRG